MGDHENVMAEVRAAYGVREITDGCARTIASMYHNGQASVGYSFASTGAIPECADDLWRDLWPTSPAEGSDEYLMLGALGTYCLDRVDRGPVQGWASLWVASHVDYPHEPGGLYDCPACEAACYCTPDAMECVHCGA